MLGFCVCAINIVQLCLTNWNEESFILNGETRSRVYHPKDRQTAFIFGDARIAFIVEENDAFGKSFFYLTPMAHVKI